FFFSSRRRHTRFSRDWSSDVCSSDLELGFQVLVGGGLGRTPMVGAEIRSFLPWKDLLTYLEAILRVYNRYGRRDNKFKARIKILVKALSPEVFAEKVEAEWENFRDTGVTLTEEELQRVSK